MVNDDYDEFNIWDIRSIIHYIITHYEKFLLFLVVIVIIYTVDYISNINAIMFSVPQIIPGITNITNNNNILSKPGKKNRKK